MLMLMHTHTVLVHFILAATFLAKMHALCCRMAREAEEKNKRGKGGGIERRRAGFKCD